MAEIMKFDDFKEYGSENAVKVGALYIPWMYVFVLAGHGWVVAEYTGHLHL